jgi:hypothetical protein
MKSQGGASEDLQRSDFHFTTSTTTSLASQIKPTIENDVATRVGLPLELRLRRRAIKRVAGVDLAVVFAPHRSTEGETRK